LENTYQKEAGINRGAAGINRGFQKNGRQRHRDNEPFEVMLRRFFRDVQQSGLLTEIKKRRFREKNVSREIIRQAARRKAARKKIKRGY